MAKRKSLDEMDQVILRILSGYEHLTPLELWFELGEDDNVKEKPTEDEVTTRLESLTARGLVERATSGGAEGQPGPSLGFRTKATGP